MKGARFSHFGGSFCRHDFQARFDEYFFSISKIFLRFLDPLLGSVLGQLCEKMQYGKRFKKRVGKELEKGHARKRLLGPVSP